MKWLARGILVAVPLVSLVAAYITFGTDLDIRIKAVLAPVLLYSLYCAAIIGWRLGRRRRPRP